MRDLDEKRKGLLIRMSFHRSCVASKATQAPLILRGWVRETRRGVYEITHDGKIEAHKLIEQFAGKHIETYSGISIGSEVMILKDSRNQK